MSEVEATVRRSSLDVRGIFRQYSIIVVLLAFVIILTVMTGGTFVRPNNLVNVVSQIAPTAIIACGMTFVIIINGIDLSVGSIVCMSAVFSASFAQQAGLDASQQLVVFPGVQFPGFVPIVAGLAMGTLIGMINGLLIITFKLPPFIATLGMLSIARGLGNIFAGSGRPISNLTDSFNYIGSGNLLGIPFSIWLLLVVIILTHILLRYTRFGKHTYALGGNEQAARVSGVNVKSLTLGIFTLSGVLAGLAGMILATQVQSAVPTVGTSLELDAIAAAVIGGTSFSGGVGTIWGTVIGAFIIGMINNGLTLLAVSAFWTMAVKGAIIIVAIIIDELKNR